MAASNHAWTIERSRNYINLSTCSAMTPQALIRTHSVFSFGCNSSAMLSRPARTRLTASSLLDSMRGDDTSRPAPIHLQGLNRPKLVSTEPQD